MTGSGIIEQPTIAVLNVQVWNDVTEVWDDWSGSVSYIDVYRGGEITVDVGTMNVVLISGDDPIADESLTPNTAVRLVLAGTTTPIYTGTILDARLEVVRNGTSLTNQITLHVVDAVYQHNSTTRYGAVSDSDGHETWVERITRLALSSRTAVSLPTEPETPYLFELQDVAYVSSLANHFRLACQTVGAGWYVGADNVTRFRAPDDDAAPVAEFADVFGGDLLQYQSVNVARSTSDVANVLKITNHGRGNDGNTFDVATTFEDAPSIAEWGARVAETDMSLWDADTYLSGRATEIFTALADPVRSVTSFRWNAQQDPDVAALLEIQARVTVRFRGETFTTRIAWIRHEITPYTWMITVGLNPRGIPDASAATLTAGSAAAAGTLPTPPDARKPLPPSGLEVSPFAAWQGGNIVLAIVAEWDEVTLGSNGAPITVDLYEVWARRDDGATESQMVASTAGLNAAVTDPAFAIGDDWLVKVRARSAHGVWSSFSSEVSTTIGEPTEELDAPVAPIVSSWLGTVSVAWGGQLTTGPAPAFLMQVDVEISLDEDDGFTVVAAMPSAGMMPLTGIPVGESRYVRLVGVDKLGRRSEPSEPALVTVVGVQQPDIMPGAIVAEHIIASVELFAKIMSAGQITADNIDAGSIAAAVIQAGGSDILTLTADQAVHIIVEQLAPIVSQVGDQDEQLGLIGQFFQFLETGLLISAPGSPMSTNFSSSAIQFIESGTVRAYLEAGVWHAEAIETDRLRQGPWEWSVLSSGHLVLAPVTS